MKKVFVNGGSSGIGREIASHLHTLGYSVVGTSRNPEVYDTEYPLYKLHVTSDESVNDMVEKFVTSYGRIDLVVNCAGFGIGGPIEETTIEEAKAQFDTNFLAWYE